MKDRFRWVQLSDIHFHSKNEGVQTDRLRTKLVACLKEVVSECDALVLAGDYRFAPYGDSNPQGCVEFVMQLASELGVENDHIVAAPGNHDLKRGKVRSSLIDGEKKEYNPLSGIIDKEILGNLIGDFSFYFDFCEKIPGIRALQNNSDFPHDIIHLSTCDVLLLNTALTAGKDNESGSLIIASSELHKLISDRRSQLPIIAVGHHSLAELNEAEQHEVESILEDNGINLYLCGHAHNPGERSFGKRGHEITVGCIKQESTDVMATFVVGEITTTGDVNIIGYKWDYLENGWYLDPPRARSWKSLYSNDPSPSPKPQPEPLHNPFSLAGYRLIAQLGSEGIKYYWKKEDDYVESVALNQRLKRPLCEKDKNTSAYTISTSIGCILHAQRKQCRFCGTGAREFNGNLSARDIALQCIFMAEFDMYCQAYPNVNGHAREFAFMGQGEPGFNYSAVRKAIQLTDFAMEKLGQEVTRYIISTCGITDFMDDLISDIKNHVFKNRVTVHFSLHEVGDRRQELMPIDKLYDYKEFIKYCKLLYSLNDNEKIGVGIMMFDHYQPKSLKDRSYTLNEDRLKEILKVLDPNVFRIDLCAVNNTPAGKQKHQKLYSSALQLESIAKSEKFECKIFTSIGDEYQAGCGMLDSEHSIMEQPGLTTTDHFNKALILLNEADQALSQQLSRKNRATVLQRYDEVRENNDAK